MKKMQKLNEDFLNLQALHHSKSTYRRGRQHAQENLTSAYIVLVEISKANET